jgi:integrase
MKREITDHALFQNHLEKSNLREGSIKLYSDVVSEFLIEYDEVDNIDYYNMFLKKHTYDKRSSYYFFALRSFIKWKILDNGKRNMILKNLIKPKNEEPIKNTIYITPTKREEVLSYVQDPLNQIMYRIQNETGARIGDIIRLKRGSINFENYNGILAMKIDIIGKRGKKNPKWIFDKKLQNDIMKFIDEEYLDEYYYFVDFKDSRHNKNSDEYTIMRTIYNWAWQDLKVACYKAGVDPTVWSTHDFRRSKSRDIWNDEVLGKDVELLQNFLGHAQVGTTIRYIKNSGLSNQEVALRLANKNGKL